MLDQNTDRMWYVIGAVIIGAAIILIMNKTFPQLFASVGETFQNKTEDIGHVVDELTLTDGVGPKIGRNLILKPATFEHKELKKSEIWVMELTESLVEGETYTFSVKGQLGEKKTKFILGMKEMENNNTAHYQAGDTVLRGENLHQLTFTYHKDNGKYSAYGDSISLHAAPYTLADSGDSLIEWVKLEKGSKGTAYN